MSHFIFMLTHHDRTVENAPEVLAGLGGCGLRYVGFKDIGASPPRQRALCQIAHELGMEVMLEVVSTTRDAELQSLLAAREAGVDWVLGGSHAVDGVRLLAGSGIRYCPFPGTVTGHPSVLSGTPEQIADHARRLASMDGVFGVDLLAYRHESTDAVELTAAVSAAIDGPVIAAGSVRSAAQIAALDVAGAWGFTIGSAIFDTELPGGPTVVGQVETILGLSSITR